MAFKLPAPASTAATAPSAIPQKALRFLPGFSRPDTNMARARAAELALVRKNVAIKKMSKIANTPVMGRFWAMAKMALSTPCSFKVPVTSNRMPAPPMTPYHKKSPRVGSSRVAATVSRTLRPFEILAINTACLLRRARYKGSWVKS